MYRLISFVFIFLFITPSGESMEKEVKTDNQKTFKRKLNTVQENIRQASQEDFEEKKKNNKKYKYQNKYQKNRKKSREVLDELLHDDYLDSP